MLSLGTRDGRKGLGFGRQMEATELEEGEACDYQDDDASIDPDVALSYIDDKLQDVLGHFQKDFEGGVSAENLGAKFGGYGSFLPTYQRSPSVWCQPRSPPKVQNHAMQRSPNHLSLEGVHQNSSVPSSAPFAVKHGSASSSAPPPPPVSGVPSVDNSVKKDVSSYPARASVEVIPKHECVNKSVNQNDQKTLKVRIKVGPDSTSVPKNAEIYSGLGLDMSPSSSYDSPAESGGLSPESPGNILQIMTSFPVPGGLLLSPLHDSLIHLSENEKLQRDGRSGSEYKGSQESSGVLVDDSFSVVGISEVVGERKVKSKDKSNRSLEVKIGSGKDSENDITSLSKKETDIETMAGKELVSYASKHPLISSTKFGTGDTTKGSVKDSDTSRVANKVVVKEKIFSSGLVREEALESVPSLNLDVVDKQSSKIGPDKLLDLRRDRSKGNKSYDYDICAPESDATKGRRDLDDGATGGPKHKVGPKVTSREQDGVKRPHVKEQLSSSGKRKSKGSKSNRTSIAEFPKESLNLVSSSVSKDKKKNSQAGDHPLKSRSDDVKSRKDGGMTMDNHGDSIGESVLEKAEDRVGSLEMAFKARQNDSKPEIFDKGVHTLSDKPKHRSGGAKVGSQLALASQTFPRETLAVAPLMENGPVSDAVHPPPPSVIEENWVCCDKCQRWRLLPFGMEPTVLPEKWVCSMLDWLSGMNRCDISEEETTRAVYAAYQVPFTEGQNNMHSQLGAAASAVTLDGVQHLDQSHNNLSQRSLPVSAKKRPVNHMGSIHSSSSTKKNQQHSAKSRSLDDVNQLPLESNPVNKPVFQQLSKSGDLAVDKRMHKQKEKQKRLDSYLDGGVSKNSKTKNKREADQSESRSSKKVKTEGLCYSNGEWNSDLGIAQPCSSSGLPAKAPGKGQNKFNEHSSSKDSKHDDRESFPAKKLKDKVLDYLDGGAAQDLVKSDKMDAAAKKRKVKEWQENQVYLDPTSGNHFQDSKGSVEEETSKSGRPKVKKAKASKSEAKESSTSKGDGRTDRKGQVTKIVLSGSKDQSVDGAEGGGRRRMEKGQQLGQYQGVKNGSQRTLDVVDSLKRDLGYGQPPMAATSSSSKVSGSRKTKTNFQEVKGSPVESVSSSPLRFSNPDKLISSGREMLGKDDAMNCGVSVMGSPRRFSDGEGDGGSDRSGMMKKEQTFSVLDHGVMESPVLDYQDKDADHAFNGKGNMQVEHPPEFESTNLVNGDAHTMDRHNRFQNDPWVKDHDFNEERLKNGHHRVNGSLPRKSGIGSSSRSKEKHRSSKSGFDKGKVKLSDSFSEHEDMYAMKSSRYEAETESHDRSPYHQELRDGKYTFQDKCASKSNKNEKTYSGKKDAAFKWSSESGRREKQLKHGGHDGADMKLDVACSRDGKSIAQQNLPLGREGERSSSRFLSEKNDKMDAATGRGKSHSVDKQERQTQCPRLMPVASSDAVDASASGGDASKVSTHHRKPDNHNGASHSNLRHSTPNGLVGVKDFNAPSPARRDSSGQVAANTALKEAKALKHSADRLQDPGSDLERTELYFEAALKFLHAASLLEPFSNEATRSKNVYSETAMLCGFCAREYERLKEMAAAAMAYKCMEVAHMKVIYSKQFTASKDQMELQNALKLIPGESPSSSASDIDNLNNQAAVDKIAVAKDNSSQVAGNHVIVARNRPTFERLLGFTRDVTCAMEASRKSQNAFAAANASLEESQLGEGISSVKRVLEFSFHDVEGLLRLVRLAMQVISR